ncbi:MAG: radical SAM protein [Elusimicrobiales bacterium]|nr:radical SAM protein [Elusimicrobiales bacterium]
MKVLLVSPALKNMDVYQVRARGCMPPLNLLYIAGVLTRGGHEVLVVDLYAEALSDAEFLARARAFGPDMAAFATYTASFDMAAAGAQLLKKNFPGLRTAAGGIHASYLPAQCLRSGAFDFVVVGEGEQTTLELANALAAGGDLFAVPGLVLPRDGKPFATPPRPLIEDLDSLPLPDYGLIDLSKYYLGITRAVSTAPAASVLTMRGCPYKCTFCSHHYGYGGRLRKRAPAKVVAEMRSLYDNYAVREFQFEDPSFTCDPAHVREICRLIVESGMKISWNCNVRANTASDELFADMAAAGCRRALLGVESGSQALLDRMKKGITLDAVRRTMALTRKHGMRVNAAFILGTPGETRGTARQTYEFARELDPDYVMFSVYIPSPGGELFDQLAGEGRLDLDKVYGADYITVYSEREPMVELSEVPAGELLALMEDYTRGFYLRPSYVLKRLRTLLLPGELGRVLWGVALIFSHQLRILKDKLAGKKIDENGWTY